MIKIYRKKTTIKAEQFDGSQKMIRKYAHLVPKNVPEPSSNSWVTKNGLFEFHIGDWFISKPDGIYGPINNADFERDNTELSVIPKYVADYIENNQDEMTLFDIIDDAMAGFTKLDGWITSNQESFVRAWLDGYQVEGD